MLYGYKYYSCNSSEGLANYNKEAFLKLRKDYNKKLNEGIEDYILLYVLIVFLLTIKFVSIVKENLIYQLEKEILIQK